jgi:hypothetical protein
MAEKAVLQVRVVEGLLARIDAAAEPAGLTRSEFVRVAIAALLEAWPPPVTVPKQPTTEVRPDETPGRTEKRVPPVPGHGKPLVDALDPGVTNSWTCPVPGCGKQANRDGRCPMHPNRKDPTFKASR